jgi:multiple sugar transport system permease protein
MLLRVARPPLQTDRGGTNPWRVLAVTVVSVVFLLPLWLTIVGSLRRVGAPPAAGPEWLPADLAWRNYVRVFETVPLARFTVNSILVAAVAVPVGVVVSSWAGFALARLPSRQATLILVCCAIAVLSPASALVVGRVAIWRALNVADTPVPLMATGLVGGTPLAVLLFAWAFRRLPEHLFDLAREIGLSPFQTWRRVALPLVRPITVAVAALAFLVTWGSYTEPLVVLSTDRWFTVPFALRSLASLDAPLRPLMLAGAVICTAPVVVAFFVILRSVGKSTR